MRAWFNLAIIAAILSLSLQLFTSVAGGVQSDRLTVHILDVGQGDAIHIRLPDSTDILVDTGPDDRILGALGGVMPMRDRAIELLVISHHHADHVGGLPALLGEYEVNQLWQSGAAYESATYRNNEGLRARLDIEETHVAAGTYAERGETKIAVLYPPSGMAGQNPKDPHDATVVLKITYREFCVLLTGDLNTNKRDHEAEIIELARQLDIPLNCQALKITHHGSGSGTTEAFLDASQPQAAFISVGERNRHKHPAPSVLQRLGNRSVPTYRTDRHGTITLTTDGASIWTKTEK